MVSKVVIVAFVALCCAQAMAAPREEKLELESANLNMNVIKCTKSVFRAANVLKDAFEIYTDFRTIYKHGQTARAVCKFNEKATEEEIEVCIKGAKSTEMNQYIKEVQVAAQKAASAFEDIKDVVEECS